MNKCYACENKAVTREHVPPQCLFPEEKDIGINLRKNLITVPSCEEHNLKKSGDDEYLLYVLSMNLTAEGLGECHFATKVVRAINRRPSLIKSLVSNSKPVIMNDRVRNKIYETLEINADGERIANAIELIALGIYRSHYGKSWCGGIRSVPEFLVYPNDPKAVEWASTVNNVAIMAEQLFANEAKYGENPEVFYYQVVQPRERQRVVMRLTFYSGCRVTVLFSDAS